MCDGIFQIAYDCVRARIGSEAWLTLSPQQITDTIYQEMRRIDAERVAAACKPIRLVKPKATDRRRRAAG